MSLPDNTQSLIRKFEPVIKDLNIQELHVLNRMVVERIRIFQKANALFALSQFHVGDRVSWSGRDGIRKTGVITRLNRKTASVRTDDFGDWNVPPQILEKGV